MRRKLVETLYTQPLSLALGAVCGIAASVTTAVSVKQLPLTVTAALLTFVGVTRVAMAYWLAPRKRGADTRLLENAYEMGAYSYAFLAGLMAALTILSRPDSHVETLMFGYALAYGTGIAARNAGRPFIAIGQLLLTILPALIACLYVGTLPMFVLGITTCFLVLAMVSITMNVFRVLKEQIIAAEASARLAEKMRGLARTDTVTGLANRAGLNQDAAELIEQLPPTHKLAMFWLDLDKFKEVNDTLGHPIGDRLLAETARRLNAHVPEGACVARFGGDEFVVVAEVPGRHAAEKLAATLSAAIARPTRIDGRRIGTTASMGVALIPDDGDDLETLMQSADQALYHAKIGGRNQMRFFDIAMTRELVRRKEIETELRAAIQRDELSIFFQPIIDLTTGRIRAFEALVRWFHPEKGELRPDEFIPVAEDTGVIITLGNWITAQAARACAQWPEDVSIAVNLSPVQIRAPGAALGILNALREADLDPHRLELEVTESLFLDDDDNTARFIEELTAAGVRFALDDFGTGYSSLSYIHKFPFNKIKVDRSFVSGPDVGRKTDAIIRAVAELGATLGMDIVAEGLETIEQVRIVREAGCTLGQGYYFSRAVPDYLAAMLLSQEQSGDVSARIAG